MIEIDDVSDFKLWIESVVNEPRAIQELDLTNFDEPLRTLSFAGSIFLGCEMSDLAAGHITRTGGLVILNRSDIKFKIHKAHLYSVPELFEGFDVNDPDGYKKTFDYQVYEDYVEEGLDEPDSIVTTLTRRLHDHSITDALYEIIDGRKVVAIMGGHSMERSEEYYLKIAKLSRTLTQKGFLMISGGGPGAMEATHVGAYFACRTEEEMIAAINELKIRPANAPKGKEYDDQDWLHRAWKVMEKYPIPSGKEKDSMSVGIPTWLYGHEPPAPFATHIAKYFANSVREDGLLAIAKYGVVFAPGSAGTTQEIFQDATQNHYAPYNKHKHKRHVSPMILFGKDHWTNKRPLWDLMKTVTEGRPYGELLHLTDDENEIVEHIMAYDPDKYAYPK